MDSRLVKIRNVPMSVVVPQRGASSVNYSPESRSYLVITLFAPLVNDASSHWFSKMCRVNWEPDRVWLCCWSSYTTANKPSFVTFFYRWTESFLEATGKEECRNIVQSLSLIWKKKKKRLKYLSNDLLPSSGLYTSWLWALWRCMKTTA